MSGWIKLYRKIIDNPYYFAETFCRSMAWIDLLLLANHEDGIFYKRGIKVEVKRGQLGYDVDTLAKRWKWSRGKVERWLFELEKSNQIVRQKTNVTTLITITNYDIHQGGGNANDKANDKPNSKANSKANGHEQERIKNNKEFYASERTQTDNTSFHFFVDYLLGNNELNRPFSKILNMKDPIGHVRFDQLQALAAEHSTKIMDKVRGIENHKTQYASFNLTLTNWIKKENNVR